MGVTPKPKTCPACGETFVPRRLGQKVCSKTCAGRLVAPVGGRANAERARRETPRREKICPVCGERFVVLAGAFSRKTCSRRCGAQLRGRPVGRAGRANPNYQTGQSVGKRPPAAWRNALGPRCESPLCTGSRGQFLHLHHVVYLQALRREGADLWDPANAMTLCATCHAKHHHRTRVIPLAALPAAAVAFAVGLLGEDRGRLYLARRYAAPDQ